MNLLKFINKQKYIKKTEDQPLYNEFKVYLYCDNILLYQEGGL